jgi:hypothetical protein
MIEYQAKGIGAAEEGIQSLLLEHYKNVFNQLADSDSGRS